MALITSKPIPKNGLSLLLFAGAALAVEVVVYVLAGAAAGWAGTSSTTSSYSTTSYSSSCAKAQENKIQMTKRNLQKAFSILFLFLFSLSQQVYNLIAIFLFFLRIHRQISSETHSLIIYKRMSLQ